MFSDHFSTSRNNGNRTIVLDPTEPGFEVQQRRRQPSLSSSDRSDRRYALVTAGHRFLLRVLPVRYPDSRHALEQFIAVTQQIPLSPSDVDAVLVACLRVLDRDLRRLPGLVVRYLDLQKAGDPIDPFRRFASCIDEALRYRGVGDPVVQTAIALIEERYADPKLTPGEVARAIGQSPSQLSVSFSRETGLHVSEYIRETRLTNASRLLASVAKRIKEVWTKVGYNDASNFDHDFKGRFGVTPSQYRASVIHPWMVERVVEAQSTTGARRSDLARPTVLIVDDDEETRATCGRYLYLEGHAVATAHDAAEAIREVEHASPDVILLDQRLPDMNGLDCLRALPQQRPGPSPAVALFTADWDVYDYEDEVHALNALIASKLCRLEEVGRLVTYLGGMKHTRQPQ